MLPTALYAPTPFWPKTEESNGPRCSKTHLIIAWTDKDF